MKNNLKLFRTESGLTPKQLSLLLNMSVHTYNAIERDRIPLPFEIGEMLSGIYLVSSDKLMSDTVTANDLSGAHKLAALDESEKFDLALYTLTGSRDMRCLYRKINAKKQSILSHSIDDK
jgi:DNA-binding XRE family transcriptional regulator